MRAMTLAALACSLGLVACGKSANPSGPATQLTAPSTVRAVATATPPSVTAAVPPQIATPAGAGTARVASPQATQAATAAASVSIMMTQPAGDPQQWHFEPATVTVKAGGTVTWTNPRGNEIHTATADDGKSFDSNVLSAGDTFSHTFSTPGTFPYHCTLHNWMKGVVTVVP